MADDPETPKATQPQAVTLVGASMSMHKVDELLSGVVVSNAFEAEDEFKKLYIGNGTGAAIAPPYNFKVLDRLCQENNALSPCIEAMVTNIDGTGFEFERVDGETEKGGDDTKIDELEQFFAQVWPGESFTTVRMKLRRDEERIGNAYLEVVRNMQDALTFIRQVDGKTMRIMQLSDPVPVKTMLMRGGKEVGITMMTRQRRYMQYVGVDKFVYFKAFGATGDLDKNTGNWAPAGQRLPAKDRATEILHFRALPDASGPYGVPRWISQLPSVLGSRKAEEFNMEFFDNGGVPPVLLLVEGGILAGKTKEALTKKTSGLASKLNRVQVIETEPTGGSLDKPNTVKVRVERFGSERQADSMFEVYDDKCESRVRKSFRLPPIFVGKSDDYSFATAYASYTVAEAQVFRPERDEFDEIISTKVLPAMGYGEYKMKSLPLSIEDSTNKLKGIELAISTNRVEPEDVVNEINIATGTNLKISDGPVNPVPGISQFDADGNVIPAVLAAPANQNAAEPKQPGAKPDAAANGVKVVATKSADGILALAVDTMISMRDRNTVNLAKNLALVGGLSRDEMQAFETATASLQFLKVDLDPEGLSELASCTMAIMAENTRQLN